MVSKWAPAWEETRPCPDVGKTHWPIRREDIRGQKWELGSNNERVGNLGKQRVIEKIKKIY